MIMATVGLKFGTMKKAARPATATDIITARMTISLAFGELRSNLAKNGTIAYITSNMETMKYL